MRIILSLLFAVSGSVLAADARARLEAFTSGLRTLSGEFMQITTDANGEVQEQSHGTLALAAPRQFRWQYQEPFPELIVADGNNVWIYDQELEQVTVRNQSAEESQSPLSVLVDLSRLDRDYEVRDLGNRSGLDWLGLTPRAEEPSFRRIEIGFDAQGPRRMLLEDLLGNHTEWTFSAWQRNPSLTDGMFRFDPPAGVDVIGTPTRSAETMPLR